MPTTLIIVAAVAILIILLATASYKVCPADRVMVITGPGGRRFVSGGSAFIIPFIMRVDWLSLGAVQSLLRTDTPIPTKDAILIDVNAAVLLFQSIDLYCSVHARTSYADMIDQHAKAYYEDNKEYVETHYGRESYPTLTECKQYMRRDYPRAKFYYGYRGGFNERLSERFEELRKQSLDIPSGRELVASKSQRVNDYFDNLELKAARVATARGSKAGFVRGVSDANNVGLGLSEMGVSSHALLNA